MKNSSLIAVRILIALHDHHCTTVKGNLATPVPKRIIAASVGFGDDYIEVLIKPLRNAGIVSAVRGVKGGFRLKKPLRQIFLREVVRLYEPDPDPSAISNVEKAVRHLTLGKSAGTTIWQIRELARGM